ncbi:MAG: tetratricopeptide repeat protein [Spirochaetaceae bacterium]|nr:tetratricopeptide repeat protein [Spirochaetaceae bacterium]
MSDQDIFFVEIPKDHSLALLFKKEFPDFTTDIPLPFLPLLEPEEQKDNAVAHDTKAALTSEMIIAGLTVLFAFYREHPHFEYYRSLFLALKPKAKTELISVALFQLNNFEFEESLLLLKTLEGLYPNDPVILVHIAQVFESRAEFYERSDLIQDARAQEQLAESYYTEAVLAEPPLPQTFFSAAFFYLSQKNYAKARTLFNTYINLETGKSEEIRYKKKQVLAIIKNINEQELDDLAYADAIAFIRNDEDEKALSRIHDFLAEHPKSWNGWFVLGWALRKLGRFTDAEKAFLTALENGKTQKSLEIEDAYSDICNELSLCSVATKEYEKAKNWLLSAFERDTENIKIISNLGMVYYYEGDFEMAKGFFNTVLTLHEDDVTARTMLERIKTEKEQN